MLYIVATPIGNLSDISQRALTTLQAVDVIVAESIPDTKRLLSGLNIHGKRVIKYNDNNKIHAQASIVDMAREYDVAYVSSAGMPGISDPGSDLVNEARKEGIQITVIPGPSALITAIAGSGIRARQFTFVSFPPKKKGKLSSLFELYKEQEDVLVFFESTHRVIKTLTILQEVAPEAHVVVAKELTKLFEKFIEGTPTKVLDQFGSDPKLSKGEFTLVIDFSNK